MSSLLNIYNSTPKNTVWSYIVHINIKWSCIVHIMQVNLTWEHKKKRKQIKIYTTTTQDNLDNLEWIL